MIHCTLVIDNLYFQFSGPPEMFGLWMEWCLKTFKPITGHVQIQHIQYIQLANG